MSGFGELAELGVTVRPFSGSRPAYGNRYSPFSAGWSSTVSTLAKELRALSAKRVVLELDVTEGQLRIDGLPKSSARIDDPAVAIAFESRFGPLRYATGEFTDWKDNLRAVALSMEALRAVDRYGVSKRGEQYRGWRQLTAGPAPDVEIFDDDEAIAVLAELSGTSIEAVVGDTLHAFRRAAKATHPDAGGNAADFARVQAAKKRLLG